MNGGYFANAGVFLIEIVFGLYIFAIMLRFILQIVHANFSNPLCQAILTVTDPVVRPMRRTIPAIGRIDSASVLLMIIVQLISSYLVYVLLGLSPGLAGLVLGSIAELINKALTLFIYAIFIQIILSWIAPGTYNPVVSVIDAITTPLLRPARRLLPPLGGIDLSPMLVIIGLILAKMLVVAPLLGEARSLM